MTIREVIRLARELTDAEGAVVDRNSILPAFVDRLDKNEEAYLKDIKRLDGEAFQLLSVESGILAPTRSKLKPMEIVVEEVDQSVQTRDALYGYIDYCGELKSTVVIKPKLRPCWERFTIAKELLHLYSGTMDDKGMTEAQTQIQAAKESRSLIVSEATELDDETAAFYLAIEVMLPWRLRNQFMELKNMDATPMQIAKVFMVPMCIIEHILLDSPERGCSYVALSRRINQNI